MNERKIVVRRRGPEPGRPWQAMLDEPAQYHGPTAILVGYYPTHPEALMRGITAARFVEAGVSWRAEGLPEVEAAS